jgi:hypothetical protein
VCGFIHRNKGFPEPREEEEDAAQTKVEVASLPIFYVENKATQPKKRKARRGREE